MKGTYMKLSQWAKNNGLKYETARQLYHKGQLPVNAIQLASGTILVQENIPTTSNTKVAIYSRVSSHDQKEDINRQSQRLQDFCSSKGYIISHNIQEIASGLNSKRPKLNKLLADNSINIIIVEHKDRLTRFGFDHIAAALSAHNRKLIVINETDSKVELVQDFIDVVTSMCARIYGKRSATNKSNKIIKEITDSNE